MLSLYEIDFLAWTQEQAELLRNHQWNQLDLPNLIEEIESLGKQQRQDLRNRLSILVGHLLKWEYQPRQRSRSWLATIRVQRRDIIRLLGENPSLKPYLQEALQLAYDNGKDLAEKLRCGFASRNIFQDAAGETDLPFKIPQDCPYQLEEILGDRFYPGISAETEDF